MTSRAAGPSFSSSSFSVFNFDRYRDEVNLASGKDDYRKLVDNTKKRAVYQAGSYDEFKSLVATCHLKPLEKNEGSILTAKKSSLLREERKKLNRGISQAYETAGHSYLIQNRSSRCSSSSSSGCMKTGVLASEEKEDSSVETSLSSSSFSSSDGQSDEDTIREVALGQKEEEERREKEEKKRSSREKKEEETKERKDDMCSGSSGVCTPDDSERRENLSFSPPVQKDAKSRTKYLSLQEEEEEMKRRKNQTSSLFSFGVHPSGFSLKWNSFQTDLEKVMYVDISFFILSP